MQRLIYDKFEMDEVIAKVKIAISCLVYHILSGYDLLYEDCAAESGDDLWIVNLILLTGLYLFWRRLPPRFFGEY